MQQSYDATPNREGDSCVKEYKDPGSCRPKHGTTFPVPLYTVCYPSSGITTLTLALNNMFALAR